MGTLNRTLAWDWAASEIKTHVVDLIWLRADISDTIVDISPNAITLIRNCRSPLYSTAAVVREWFDLWMLIGEQRVARRGRPRRDSAAFRRRFPRLSHSFGLWYSAVALALVAFTFERALCPLWLVVICGRASAIWRKPPRMKISRRHFLGPTRTHRNTFRCRLPVWIPV